ncbi:hypothetical protein INT47_012631, partial [Mucor saturninus]
MLSSNLHESLNNKVAVITGGSRGIGKAVAEALVKNGAKIVIGDLLEKEGRAVVDCMNKKAKTQVAVFIQTDVTKYSDNIALFKLAESEFGGVDYAFLNAGVSSNADSMFSPLDDQAEEEIININTTAVIKGTKVALLYMAKRGGGSIVHMASTNGFYNYPFLASYCASKHAVIGYTRSFGLMPQICNVRVNAICPFWVDTDLVIPLCDLDTAIFPESKIIKNEPRTSINTVVEGVLLLLTDESRNTQAIMALPDGLQIVEPLAIPASFKSHESENIAKEYIPAAVTVGKQRLAEALEKFERDQR